MKGHHVNVAGGWGPHQFGMFCCLVGQQTCRAMLSWAELLWHQDELASFVATSFLFCFLVLQEA